MANPSNGKINIDANAPDALAFSSFDAAPSGAAIAIKLSAPTPPAPPVALARVGEMLTDENAPTPLSDTEICSPLLAIGVADIGLNPSIKSPQKVF